MGKSLLHQGQGCLRPLLDGLGLPTAVMEPERKSQGETEAERVRQLLGQGERLVAACFRIAEHPQRQGGMDETGDANIMPVERPQGAMLLGVIEGDPLLRWAWAATNWPSDSQVAPRA